MNILQIIQLAVSLAPAGLTAIEDIIAFIQSLATAINGTPGTPEHTAAVTQVAALTQKAKTA